MTTARARPVFVYGSLMVDTVLRALLGRPVALTPGRIDGWRRCGLQGLPYPVIVADAGAATSGLVITDLDDEERALFDAFEGPEYLVVPVRVLTAAGPLDADVYAASDELSAIAEPDDWDPRRLDDVLEAYIENCVRFRLDYDDRSG